VSVLKSILVMVALAYGAAALSHGDEAHTPGNPDSPQAKPTATVFGIAADPRKASRTVRVEMSDSMRFTPSKIEVRRGEAVRFVAANKGQVLHELVLGTLADLRKHAELMKQFPGMQHDEPHMVHVAPGRTETLAWQFTRAGEFYYGCLIPGHFEAGMIGKVVVQ
jgi:uncharacterized cupredoxin-like copper-binding protein